MSDDRRGSRTDDYRAARAGAALALTIAIITILLIDAFSPAYEVSAVTVGVLATLIAGLLAVDLPDLLRPGR